MSNSLGHNGLETARLLCPWESTGKNTALGSHSLLHGIFLTQGSNLDVLHCRWILYHLSHEGSHSEIQFSSVQSLSRVRLFVTPWIVAHKSPLSMEFSRQEYWSG